jgi:hypothetical protein
MVVKAMNTRKIAKYMVLLVLVLLWLGARPLECRAWSLWQPLGSEPAKSSKAKKPAHKNAKKQPSAIDRMFAGTKGFFNDVGDVLTLRAFSKKKPAKPSYAHAVPASAKQPKQEESKPWFSLGAKPEEKKKSETVSQWIDKKRLDP